MGLFDNLMGTVKNEAKKAVRGAAIDAVNNVGKGKNSSQTFTFSAVPTSLAELQAIPEATLNNAFATTALAILVLCNFENNPDATFEMLDFLKGPADVSGMEKQFIKEKLGGKAYKARSFFAGATPDNNYTPTTPLTITVSENPYSFDEENWATLYVKSGGAGSGRPIKLRKKPSTNQWFINDIQCLADIRVPTSQNEWA